MTRFLLLAATLLCASVPCLAQPLSVDPAERAHWSSRGFVPLWDRSQDGTYSPARYLLVHDIVIDSGKVMTFEGGSEVFALRNARIIVKGRLICDGGSAAPVTFSPLDAAAYYVPVSGSETPRWEGIVVEPGGELLLRHAKIRGARQGVEAKAGFERMWLDSVTFADIADTRVVVSGRVVPVKDLAPFSLRTSGAQAASGTPGPRAPGPRARWKAPMRISLASVAVAGAGLAILCQLKAADYQRLADGAPSTARADDYARRGDTMYNLRNVCVIAGILGTAGCAVTFFF